MVQRGRPSRLQIYARLDEAVQDLRTRLGGLPQPAEADGVWDSLWLEETHHSTALEGNTLVLAQVRELLAEGRAVGDKELREYMEVQGYAAASKWVYGQAFTSDGRDPESLLALHEVREVHYRAMQPVWGVSPHPQAFAEESPGNWRRHDIQTFPAGMRPPEWTEIDALMRDWVRDVNAMGARMDRPIAEQMAWMHNVFERIHPFLDGNGRAGRLLMNLVLLRLGYPPAIIRSAERAKYLRAMRAADGGDYGPLGELIARAVTNNLLRFIVPAVAGPAKLVPLASLADPREGLTVAGLRAAAQRGRLRAQQDNSGQWLSSKQWVAAYVASRYIRKA